MFFQAPMGPISVNTTWYSFTPTHQVESCYIMLSSLWLHKNFHPECGSFTLSSLAVCFSNLYPIYIIWRACVDLSAIQRFAARWCPRSAVCERSHEEWRRATRQNWSSLHSEWSPPAFRHAQELACWRQWTCQWGVNLWIGGTQSLSMLTYFRSMPIWVLFRLTLMRDLNIQDDLWNLRNDCHLNDFFVLDMGITVMLSRFYIVLILDSSE